MKRFIADLVLVLILVSVGSYVLHKDETTIQNTEQKATQFEESVTNGEVVKANKASGSLNDIEENKAGKLAKKSSEFVVDTIRGTVKTFSDVFEGVLN